jgi:hypothetical protein
LHLPAREHAPRRKRQFEAIAGVPVKRHSMFEQVPRGLCFYSARDGQGYWVPVPIYWILHTWRKLHITYLRWKLKRK